MRSASPGSMTLPVVGRVSLPSYGFIAWRGLFTSPMDLGPVTIAVGVSLAWFAVASLLAWRGFRARDFTDLVNDGAGRRLVVGGLVPVVGVLAASVFYISVAGGVPSGSGTKAKLDRSLADVFGHLNVLQTRELRRPAVREEQLRARASCDKGGPRVQDAGPGNDWRCVVSWQLPGSTARGQAIYQLDATPDGRYVADGDGPQAVNGFFQARTATGDAPNPLWQFDGVTPKAAAAS